MTRDRTQDAPRTAADLISELERDPAFVARRAAREEERRKSAEEYQRAARELLSELAAIGFPVASVGELPRLRRPYPDAVPVLLWWLKRVDHAGLKEDIVRALSVPWAPEALGVFLHELPRAVERAGLTWALANGVEILADDGAFDAIAALVLDRRYGPARGPLATALQKLRDPRAPAVLAALLDDPEVAGPALKALVALGHTPSRERIEPLLSHGHAWVREEAARVLSRGQPE